MRFLNTVVPKIVPNSEFIPFEMNDPRREKTFEIIPCSLSIDFIGSACIEINDSRCTESQSQIWPSHPSWYSPERKLVW